MRFTGSSAELRGNFVVAREQERHHQCHVEEEAMRIVGGEPPRALDVTNSVRMLSSTYKGLLSAVGKLGLASEAATLRDALLGLEPQFSIQEAIDRSPLLRQEDLDSYAEGLRLAGIPERSGLAT